MLQPRAIIVSNQYGGRVGGPIRNKTFFNAYYEGQRRVRRTISWRLFERKPARESTGISRSTTPMHRRPDRRWM
jgi:hypothetical protein